MHGVLRLGMEDRRNPRVLAGASELTGTPATHGRGVPAPSIGADSKRVGQEFRFLP